MCLILHVCVISKQQKSIIFNTISLSYLHLTSVFPSFGFKQNNGISRSKLKKKEKFLFNVSNPVSIHSLATNMIERTNYSVDILNKKNNNWQ